MTARDLVRRAAPLALTLLAGCASHSQIHPAHLGLCGLVVLAGDIWAAYQIWTGPRDTTKKVLWSLLVWLFPFGGLLLFWIFGDRKAT